MSSFSRLSTSISTLPLVPEGLRTVGGDKLTDGLLTLLANLGSRYCWDFRTHWTELMEHLPSLGKVLEPVSDDSLRAAVEQLHLQMNWRITRDLRLSAPLTEQNAASAECIRWLAEQPSERLLNWAERLLPNGRPTGGAREAAFRLSRLRPLPLEVEWGWCVEQHSRQLQHWAPTRSELIALYAVCAAAQRLEWQAARRLRFGRDSSSPADDPLAMAREALLKEATLTVSDTCFELAEEVAMEAVRGRPLDRVVERVTSRSLDRPRDIELRLHLTRIPPTKKGPAVGKLPRARVCPVCQSVGIPAGRLLPPFQTLCTCELALDWEGEPLAEAPFDWALKRWVQVSGTRAFKFPARRVLLKLHEQLLQSRFAPTEPGGLRNPPSTSEAAA